MYNPFKKKKDNIHQLRSKAIALIADEPWIAKKEIVESLIHFYMPGWHLHHNPSKLGQVKDFHIRALNLLDEAVRKGFEAISGGCIIKDGEE